MWFDFEWFHHVAFAGLVSAIGASICTSTCPKNSNAAPGSQQCIPCAMGYFSNGTSACAACTFPESCEGYGV